MPTWKSPTVALRYGDCRLPTVAGSYALGVLRRSGYTARVIAGGSAAAYLRGEDGEIVWLAARGTAMHRRAICAEFRSTSLRPGMAAWTDRGLLIAGGRPIVELDAAAVWTAGALSAGNTAAPTTVAARVRRAITLFEAMALAPAFAHLIGRAIAASSLAEPFVEAEADAFERAAYPHLIAIVQGCLRADPAPPAAASRALIGLGPGLTPSGDDLLGGVLFALRLLATYHPSRLSWGIDNGPHLVAAIGGGTNEISRTILGDLACGAGPEPLHRLAWELLHGESQGPGAETIAAVLHIGHRSGGDLLSGFLTGMLVTLGWTGVAGDSDG